MNNILEISVSYYPRLTDKKPLKAELYDLLTTHRYKKQVSIVRNQTDTEKRKVLKDQLPTFTPSGLFSSNNGKSLIKASGMICIDIDKKDNLNVQDYDNLKDKISELPYVAYCGLSVSGEGYFCIIPIYDSHKFSQHFFSLQKVFADMGITIDQTCKDICRKRFVSFDPNSYLNLQAETYQGLIDSQFKPSHANQAPTYTYNVTPEILTKADLYIRIIVEHQIDITTEYHNWVRFSFAFANTFGELGRDKFHVISQFYPKYNSDETDLLFNSAIKGKYQFVTIKSFIHHAEKCGLEFIINDYEE